MHRNGFLARERGCGCTGFLICESASVGCASTSHHSSPLRPGMHLPTEAAVGERTHSVILFTAFYLSIGGARTHPHIYGFLLRLWHPLAKHSRDLFFFAFISFFLLFAVPTRRLFMPCNHVMHRTSVHVYIFKRSSPPPGGDKMYVSPVSLHSAVHGFKVARETKGSKGPL
uniref:Uncharacterized protein n=1 Tax=Trypanosoma vivax (strain Y486) TaxID=1055687 RepID=G0U2J0_TRYVY|nr:hypothetical protein TVY486_0903140 [Trypanosoma vivax Y486]